MAQEKLLNEHERKLLLLEQHLGLSLSQKRTSQCAPSNPAVASTSDTTLQQSKRSLQGTLYCKYTMAHGHHYDDMGFIIQYTSSWIDDEEPRPTKRLQPK